MTLRFPSGWYKSPDFLTGLAATTCSGAIFVELVQHGSVAYKLCLLGSIIFGGGAAVSSQFTTAQAGSKAIASAGDRADASASTTPAS